jgi:hypothetical protein
MVHNTISKTFQPKGKEQLLFSGRISGRDDTFANNRRIQKLKKEISGFRNDLLLFYGCIITLNINQQRFMA